MRDFIFQGDEHSCGYACLRMFIILKRRNKDFRNLTILKRPPYSLYDLQECAKASGMNLSFKKAENLESLKDNLVFPLLLVLKEGDQSHMVLLRKSKKGKFLIYDPARGKDWIKQDVIIGKWTGIFGDGEVVEERDCNCPKADSPDNWYYVSSAACLTFGIAFLGLGFFFLNQDGNFLVPVIAFASYALLEVLRKRLALFFMKKFDDKFLPYLEMSEAEYLEKDFKQYQLYKKDVFSDFVIMLASLLLVGSLGTLIGINSPSFFISLAGLISYQIIQTVFMGRNIKKQERCLEEDERMIIKDKLNNLDTVKAVQEKAYSISNQLDFQRTLEMVVMLFLSLIPFVVSENFSLNYYLLHFFSLTALNSSIHEVVEYHLRIGDRQKNKDYFLNFIKK